MVCVACGCEQVAGSRFCRQCGAAMTEAGAGPSAPGQQNWMPLGGAPQGYPAGPPPGYAPGYLAYTQRQRMRVRQNVQPLGITWILFGVIRLMTGLIGALVVHNLAYGGIFNDAPPFLPHLMASLVPVIATISVVMGAASILVGWALLSRQPWARVAAIVLAILELIKIPFGTALGIYTLWVLAPRTSGIEWDGLVAER